MELANVLAEPSKTRALFRYGVATQRTLSDTFQPKPSISLSAIHTSQCSHTRKNVMAMPSG